MNSSQESLGDLLTEYSIDAMIAINMDHNIITWNLAATLLFDVKKNKAIGHPLLNILPSVKDDPEFLSALVIAKKGKKSFLYPASYLNHRQRIETHILPLIQEDSITGILILLHDISDRIDKEEQIQLLYIELQLKVKELNKFQKHLTDLTHIATHEVKEPIKNIYTTIEMLIHNEAKNLSDKSKAAFRRMQSSLNRMNLLLDETITLTQISLVEKPKDLVKLDEILDQVKKILEQRLKESKAVLSNGDVCEIRAHKDLVVLLLQHILSNAIKNTNSPKPVFHVHCKRTDKGAYYEMSISFQADGFDKSSIAMVIASRVMEAHEGYLEKEQKGNETLIKCYFPVN